MARLAAPAESTMLTHSPAAASQLAGHRTLGLGLAASLAAWASFPPLDLWYLAWIAPIPWLMLIRGEPLEGRRPYGVLFFCGFVFWLLAVHWLRLPHPATYAGWIALALYLAVYLPLFVWLSREAVHRLGITLVLAAPVVWTGLELARGHLLTGFLMAAWGHTQFRWIDLIQISDVAGGYAVSFVVMLAAAAIARAWPEAGSRRWTIWPLITAVLVLAACLSYGRLRQTGGGGRPGPRLAVIQGSVDPDWKMDEAKRQALFDHYVELSLRAVREAHGRLDLIVWPETMFPSPLVEVDPQWETDLANGQTQPESASDRPPPEDVREITRKILAQLVERLSAPLLVGLDTWRYTSAGREHFNSAALVGADGRLVGRYDKMHLVMFGEYVPFARWFPWIYRLTPIGGGLSAGGRAVPLELSGYRYAASICFETILPQTIRRQVRQLAAQAARPDLLVSLTNDGWFYGSSELDMHLACGVFRAVECRMPLVIAANTGISAWIDADGRVVRRGPKRAPDVLLADVRLDGRESFYLKWGDWFAGLCLLACGLTGASGMRRVMGRKIGPSAARCIDRRDCRAAPDTPSSSDSPAV